MRRLILHARAAHTSLLPSSAGHCRFSGGGLQVEAPGAAALLDDPRALLLRPPPAGAACPLLLLLLPAAALSALAKLKEASSSLLPEARHADSHSFATMRVAAFAFWT